jgi:hypothetical protein
MLEPVVGHKDRRILTVALEYMKDDPVVLLEGPRSVGKSTLLREIANSCGGRVLDLDDPATLQATLVDPMTQISGEQLVCIDEYQKAPIVLDAIKAELNQRSRPGRFVLTGSAKHESLPDNAQALTGRLSRLQVLPLSQGEIDGVHEDWLEQFVQDPESCISPTLSATTKQDYVSRVVSGGFPMALAASTGAARSRWMKNYLSLALERDVTELSVVRHGARLPELVRRLAGQTAQVLNVDQAATDIGLDRDTAARYLSLLEKVFLFYQLPAWGRTLSARTARLPKIHVLDSGIAAHELRLNPARLSRQDPAALTEFGHLLETFVVGELRKQASWLSEVTSVGHWRTRDGAEVDMVLERDDGGLIAVEVKAAARVPGEQLRSLAYLRDKLGDTFVGGVVLYLGERSYKFDDRIFVAPVDRLWTRT